jgi:hypothetical protein
MRHKRVPLFFGSGSKQVVDQAGDFPGTGKSARGFDGILEQKRAALERRWPKTRKSR